MGTVAARGGEAVADGRPGRQWRLRDRVLLVSVCRRLALRRIGPWFGFCHSAAHRVLDSFGPVLAPAPVRECRLDRVAIVDGTLVPTRDRLVAAPSKNHRYFRNSPVTIDAGTCPVIATGDPQPGNRNDTHVYRESGVVHRCHARRILR